MLRWGYIYSEHQKTKIAPKIAAKIAGVNRPFEYINLVYVVMKYVKKIILL
jgi:hypothetical protein